MASKPSKLVDQYGFRMGTGQLIKAAYASTNFTTSPQLRPDIEDNLGFRSRSNLRDASHDIFANSPQLQWAIKLKSELCVGSGSESFAPQFIGDPADKEWGDKAVEMLREWHKVFNTRGSPFDWAGTLKNWSIALDLDGDFVRKFCDDGYPMIQTIPASRIGNTWHMSTPVMPDGIYAGMSYRDGVILDSYLRTVAVCLFDSLGQKQEEISCVNTFDADGNSVLTADAVLEYEPVYSGQARGIPPIGSGAIDWKDLEQVRRFTKLALKAEGAHSVIEYNEAGQVQDPNADEFSTTTGVNGGSIWQQTEDGVSMRVFKANTGSKVEFPQGSNRPSSDQREFWNMIQRNAFLSIGWPYELYNATQTGGASLRMIMELAQYSFEARQTILQRIAWQIDCWRVCKAIKSGELPMPSNPNSWRNFYHVPPEEFTADKGYSSQIKREEFKLGITSVQRVRAADGKNHQKIRAEIKDYVGEQLADAKIYSEQYGLPMEYVLTLFSQRTQNTPTVPPEPTKETNAAD